MGVHIEDDVEDRALLKGNRALLTKEPVAVMWGFILRTMPEPGEAFPNMMECVEVRAALSRSTLR